MGPRSGHTELQDLENGPPAPVALFGFERDAGLFGRSGTWKERSAKERRVVHLALDELLQPPVPADLAVRLGKIRVSEILPDGREVTRAVLQAGSVFRTRPIPDPGADRAGPSRSEPIPDPYDLGHIILMSLGEAEVWVYPAGSVPTARQDRR